MATHNIFYSWQSDLPNSTNRGFISDCVERAIKELKSDVKLKLDPCLDRDTQGIPGSPDIAVSIFEKIKKADLFVGDISFVCVNENRKCPNPNVLIESGYAASAIGWKKIICVFNTYFGDLKDLPFDLRQRRIITYSLSDNSEKSLQRKKLINRIRYGVESILYSRAKEEESSFHKFLSSMASELIPVLIFGEEFEKRLEQPWFDDVCNQFLTSANSLRELVVEDSSTTKSLDSKLDALAEILDKAANISFEVGLGDQVTPLIRRALEKAWFLKEQYIDVVEPSEESVKLVCSTLESTRRKLAKLVARSESLVKEGRYEDAKNEAANLGRQILQIGYYNLDSIQSGLNDKLIEVGHNLHLLETKEIFADGGKSITFILDTVKNGSRRLDLIINSLD